MANIKKIKAQGRISIGVGVVGLILMTYMIAVEDEPGALPLLLVFAGFTGYLISQYRLRKRI